jgi:hypothetical protein
MSPMSPPGPEGDLVAVRPPAGRPVDGGKPGSGPSGTPPSAPPAAAPAALLPQMQYLADPLADQAIADILGPWPDLPEGLPAPRVLELHAGQVERVRIVNQLIGSWARNADLDDWAARARSQAQPPGARTDTATRLEIIARLDRFVQAARELPSWADPLRLHRAEQLFFEHGLLSCMLLFCSSLPECYVVPDISAVLQATGQLEDHTEHRIRSTAAMIFPVMMKGGLTTAEGAGVAQALKVRLIHATIRSLLMRGHPALLGGAAAGHADVPALTLPLEQRQWHHVLLAHGWRPGTHGLPCNQEELAYTLLTFSFVFLRSLRRLGVRWRGADEAAYLHAWNVAGHLLGIRSDLMAHSMEQAQAWFDLMQARGRAEPVTPDPRPPLGRALMLAMESAIPLRLLKPFPVLMTRWLCRRRTMRDLGLTDRQPWLSRLLFLLGMGLVRVIDWVARLVVPRFSIARLVGRVLGYHFMTRLLMKQTRPLKLPQPWLSEVKDMMLQWSDDPGAPAWLNAVEDRLTTPGPWRPLTPEGDPPAR